MSEMSLAEIALELVKLEKEKTNSARRNEECIKVYEDYVKEAYRIKKECNEI